MRINDKQVQQVVKAYADQLRRQEKVAPKSAEQASLEVKLSPQSQEFRSAMQALRALPEQDDQLVQELRQQVDAGTYQVDSARLAKKMLSRSLVDRLL